MNVAHASGSHRLGGHVFRDSSLLERALTHRSAAAANNERLEFLGDALVGAFVAEALYLRWPKAPEGDLTRARAELVRESSLAGLARKLDLGQRILLGPGEMKSGGHRRDSILADALEAVVAAIYLDAGFDACRAAVLPWFADPSMPCRRSTGWARTPKPVCRNGCKAASTRCRSMRSSPRVAKITPNRSA